MLVGARTLVVTSSERCDVLFARKDERIHSGIFRIGHLMPFVGQVRERRASNVAFFVSHRMCLGQNTRKAHIHTHTHTDTYTQLPMEYRYCKQ